MTKYKNILKISFAATIFFVSIFQLKHQVNAIKWRDIVEVVKEKTVVQVLGLISIGCLGILLLVFYDFILLKGFKIKKFLKYRLLNLVGLLIH